MALPINPHLDDLLDKTIEASQKTAKQRREISRNRKEIRNILKVEMPADESSVTYEGTSATATLKKGKRYCWKDICEQLVASGNVSEAVIEEFRQDHCAPSYRLAYAHRSEPEQPDMFPDSSKAAGEQ